MQPHCQSCGMPMQDDSLRGAEKNGSKNEDYCVYCYENGEFKQPDVTMEGMIDICVPFMTEEGMDEGAARSLLRTQLPGLKRWRTA